MSDYIVNPIKKVAGFTYRHLELLGGHQLKKTPCMYNRTINASDSIDSYQVVVLLVEEQTDKVVMGGKFSRGDGGRPSDAKGGY